MDMSGWGSKLYPPVPLPASRMDGAKCLLQDDFGLGKRFGGAIASLHVSFFCSINRTQGTAY